MVRLMRLTALLLCAAACGNPDNLVIGGISATATIPVALVGDVHSAISGIATYNKSGQQISQRTVVILSNTGGLCDQLGSHPDYFRNPPEAYVAILLYVTLDRVGTFYVGRDQNTDGEIVAAYAGVAPTPYSALGLNQGIGSSYIILTDVSPSGANARGSFDLWFGDTVGNIHEFYGRFKTGSCAALQNVLLP
jgi:hypothetical protein